MRRGEIPDHSRSFTARGKVRRVRISHEETGENAVMAQSGNELARCMMHIPPEIASFSRLSPQSGMIGRTDRSPARESPECRVGIN